VVVIAYTTTVSKESRKLKYRKAVNTRRNTNNSAKVFAEINCNLYLQPEVPEGITERVLIQAEVAHLVEHDLAKVGVAGSSPVFRSDPPIRGIFFRRPGGEIGRHAGLKIL
jgi:hypothetical protein